jgi:hypothetical protein
MESLPPHDDSIAGSEPTIEGLVTVGMGARSPRARLNRGAPKAQAWCGEARGHNADASLKRDAVVPAKLRAQAFVGTWRC